MQAAKKINIFNAVAVFCPRKRARAPRHRTEHNLMHDLHSSSASILSPFRDLHQNGANLHNFHTKGVGVVPACASSLSTFPGKFHVSIAYSNIELYIYLKIKVKMPIRINYYSKEIFCHFDHVLCFVQFYFFIVL